MVSINEKELLLHIFVCEVHTCGGQLSGVGSPFTVWVTGIELRCQAVARELLPFEPVFLSLPNAVTLHIVPLVMVTPQP